MQQLLPYSLRLDLVRHEVKWGTLWQAKQHCGPLLCLALEALARSHEGLWPLWLAGRGKKPLSQDAAIRALRKPRLFGISPK